MARKKLPPTPVAADDDALPVPPKRGADRKYKNEPGTYEGVGYWISEIAAAKKRDIDFRKNGKKIREIYAGEKTTSTPFNILFSNTEIILPSLYSQVPRPVVERRFKDNDPIGKAAAMAGQKGLEFLLDTNIDGYETFHDGMKNATLDGILPGRGVCSVQYDAEVTGDDESAVKGAELVCLNTRSWDKTYFGYAKKWSAVPWIGYEVQMTKEQCVEKKFKAEVIKELSFTQGDGNNEEKDKDEKNQGESKTTTVIQIWDKVGGRKIRYVSPSYEDDFLLVADDTLGLTGFFDTPRPLMFVDKTNDMTPTAMYTLYENQATELNSLTRRINKLIAACKARGAYDSTLGDDIGSIMTADDNELVPTDKSASLAAEKGLDNAIWFMPLDTIIQTLRELYASREQCKQVIYEIMGISDIVRGASKASETLGAQQLKSQWGTLRLKNKQAEVQRYARDLLRMMLEVAASKLDEDTWAKMTGLPYLTQPQLQQLTAQAQAMQQQMQAVQAQAQMTGQQIPPQVQQQAMQQMQQVQQQLQTPQWKQILELLNNDLQRAYRIDIETNSTIEPEAAEDQKNIADLMTAMGQFLNGVGPMVQQGIMPFEVAKTMLTAITRRFRFGRDIEDQIQQMQPPKPQDDGAAQKAQAQAAQQQQQAQQKIGEQAAKINQLETQAKATQKDLQQLQKSAELDNRERKLQDEEARFKLEKQQAQDQVVKGAQLENSKLDMKKQVTTLEGKQAQQNQQVAKNMDMKVSQSVKQITDVVSSLQSQLQQIIQTVQEQGEQIAGIRKLASTPRRRKAIRDKSGTLIGSEEEPIQVAS